MVPSDILQRTYQLQYGSGTGTCFAIDVDGKQYLVTARHVVEGIALKATVALMHDKTWKNIHVQLVGVSKGNIDIAVLAPPQPLIAGHKLLTESKGIFLSQDIYFLGFPYGLSTDGGAANFDYPIALVKKGIISSFIWDGKYTHALLDGHNNPGFSGGPVVTQMHGESKIRVIGVVSGFKTVQQPIHHQDQATPFSVSYNTGIVVSYSIDVAIDIIHANPIGPTLPKN